MAVGPPAPLKSNSYLSVPWAEFVSKDGSKGTTFTSGWNDDSRAVFNIIVNWNDALQAEQDILGIAYFDGNYLHRSPPVQHPAKHSMRAEKILATHPMAWNGKAFTEFEYGWGVGGSSGAYSSYVFMMMSIGYTVPKYNHITDTDLQQNYGNNEFYRWVEVIEDERIETITREGGNYQWAAGPHTGKPFVAPLGQHFSSSTVRVLWRRVPRVGLFEDGGLGFRLNQNIRSSLNTVHNGVTPIFGVSNAPIPANNFIANANSNGSSLRLVAAKQVSIASPLYPPNQGLPWYGINTYHDVEFTFHVWDPPSGDGVNFGHNLAPSPEADGLFYLIKTSLGALLYPVSDLGAAFRLSLI